MPTDPTTLVTLAASAFAAGALNSIAGGGTLLTFPALFAVIGPAAANVTSTIALLPGSFAGVWGYRRELAGARRFLVQMLPPSLAGGLCGSLLMVAYPEDFGRLVPWLILTAATLFLLQQPINRFLRKRRADGTPHPPATGWKLAALVGFQFLTATYGGYFGAGIGILMLTSLGFMNVGSIHRMNAVKTVLASAINLVTAVVFVAADRVRDGGLIHWEYAGLMAVAAIAGGYLGARVARRLPAAAVRWTVVAIAFTLTAYYFSR